jgi:anaerobic selenocysteine-containing dehydrogenase
MADSTSGQRVHGYCGLCIARCGCVAVVEDGRFTRLEPDPAQPTGEALCAKGRAAPELVYHPERLTHPLRRTRPKGDPNPGWERIGWDEALNLTAAAMRRVAERHGPEAVAFTLSSPSTTAIADSSGFIRRLANAFGTPNAAITLMSAAGAAPLPPATPTASAASAQAPVAVPCRTSRTAAF